MFVFLDHPEVEPTNNVAEREAKAKCNNKEDHLW